MKQEIKDIMKRLLKRHKELGILDQIDYEKFYLYSIITNSTAIEGSTVTEVEAQLLFDEGITAKGKTALRTFTARYRPIPTGNIRINGR